MIEANVIHEAYRAGVKHLLFLGSSCIYPKFAPQPMREQHLLAGYLEPTNEPYAIAKIAGIKLCESYNRQYGTHYRSVMPTNLYGPGDNFSLESSHVIPALMRKFHEAKTVGDDKVTVWGTGSPRREFLHVDDLADACVFLMQNYSDAEIVNVGWGRDISIAELAELVRDVVGFEGEIVFDSSRPDGTPRKLLDIAKLRATADPVARRVARLALQQAGADPRRIASTHIEGLLGLAQGPGAKQLHLPSRIVARRVRGSRILLRRLR